MSQRIIRKVKVPHDCYIILTSRCNQRCLHCYGNYGLHVPDNELTGKEWDSVFSDLVENNVFYINISGGEPTIHPDFIEILDSLKKHQLHFIMTTNALFSEKILKKIVEVKDILIGLKVSLDGPDYKSNGYIRRDVNKQINENEFNRTMCNLEKLKTADIPFTIATCIHQGNINRLNDMLTLILKLKPVSWYLSTISTSGRSVEHLDIFASDSELRKDFWQSLQEKCEEQGIFVNYIDMPFAISSSPEKKFYFECPAARSFCEINSDGLVTPCPLARVNIPPKYIEFENIRNKSIVDIWNGEPFKKFLKLSSEGCNGCKVKDKCDRCIPQSILWFGDHTFPPPVCIKNAKSLGLKDANRLKSLLEKQMKKYERENYISIN